MNLPPVGRSIGYGAALAALFASAISAQQRQAKMLVIYGAAAGVPAQRIGADALRQALAGTGQKVALYEEFADYTWLADTANSRPAAVDRRADALRDYLARKYAGITFDVVLTAGPEGLRFYRKYRAQLFPNTPAVACIVFSDQAPRLPADSLLTVITDSVDLHGTMELALRLQPDTRHMVVVNGAAPSDGSWTNQIGGARAGIDSRVDFTFLIGQPPPDMERTVRRLPAHSVILFVNYRGDVAGRQYVPQDVVQRVVAAANAPVYTWSSTSFGLGTVGGEIGRQDSSMTRAAHLALRLINGESPSRWPRHLVNPTVTMVDGRALKRWSIPQSRLPRGAIVAFSESTVWTRYQDLITGALALFVAQAVVIFALIIQRTRRRRAERENRILLDQLKVSYDEARHFAVRLIAAQEAERLRIGRELHDDVNQKLAALSIDLSRFRQKLGAGGTSPLSDDFVRIEQAARTLVLDVRALSHQLHSGVLQHAGLVAALRSQCLEFADRHDVIVTLKPSGDVDGVPPQVSLCLYRATQEALRNVATHAKANTALVSVCRGESSISMTITDDGVGFNTGSRAATSGLGLTSVNERVHALRGTVQISSRHGGGTTMDITIPLAASPTTPLAAITSDLSLTSFEVHAPHARSAR